MKTETTLANNYQNKLYAGKINRSSLKRWISIILFFTINILAIAQNKTGCIKVTLLDKKTKESIPFGNIVVFKEKTQLAVATTDLNGKATIKDLAPGKYNVKAVFIGYLPQQINNVKVDSNKTSYVTINLSNDGAVMLECVTVTEYATPLIDADTKSGGTITRESFSHMASKDISSVLSTEPGVIVRGSRASKTEVFIDGEGVIESLDKSSAKTNTNSSIKAGTLTAGEINDFKKWDLWKDLGKEGLSIYQKTWKINPESRYSVMVINQDKKPVVDANINLYDKAGNILWKAKTDNTGRAELWVDLFEDTKNASYIETEINGKKTRKDHITTFQKGINIIEVQNTCNMPDALDLLFVVDATSSMGDELNYLKEELSDIITKTKQQLPTLKINLGSVFYKDESDDYVTKKSPLSTDIKTTLDFISKQEASGGGDYPEAVDKALEVAINETNWSTYAAARILFLVLDAPPHENDAIKKSIQTQIAKAAEKGIKIIPLVASGTNKSTEYLMRSFALATNGTYVFLTDHSGVGGEHLKPSTNEYDVELLNSLMLRLINQYSKTVSCQENNLIKKSDLQDTTSVQIIDHVIIDSTKVVRKKNKAKKNSLENNSDTLTATSKHEVSDSIVIKKSFKFYPNPSRGKVTIEVEGSIDELLLCDSNGKLLERYAVGKDKTEADISMYPDGLYLLQYQSAGKWFTGKLILMRD
jgi:hypothetical protein